MIQMAVVLFFSFVVSSQSSALETTAWPLKIPSLNLSTQNPYYTTQFKVSLQTVAKIQFNYTGIVHICIQAFVQTPYYTQIDSRTCTIFYSTPLAIQTSYINYTVPLRNINYYFTLAYDKRISPAFVSDFILSGPTCSPGYYFYGNNCRQAYNGITPGNNFISFHGQQSSWFHFSVPHTSGFNLSCNVKMYVRWEAPATIQNYDESGFVVTVNYPNPGTWWIYIPSSLNKADHGNLVLSIWCCDCDQGGGGPNCYKNATSVSFDTQLFNESLTSEGNYYAYPLEHGEEFFVSVMSQSGPLPDVYVSLNQFPTLTSYLSTGCNQRYCSPVSRWKAVVPDGFYEPNATWYVYVSPVNTTAENDSYAIWFGTTCPSGCVGARTSCGESSYNTGICLCRYGWSGIICDNPGHVLQTIWVTVIIICTLAGVALIFSCCSTFYMSKNMVYDNDPFFFLEA
eukprot:TRINITY_DN22908_c0_g1_i1.p1 TRINITY_DN22908_c0_g1~~TRINITY_DN22908_c0_g1_i1.p1  ORF type:complete len:454 (-),score=34.22 TRINITY_DN22908_c0_g1_i1:95-1456(-)